MTPILCPLWLMTSAAADVISVPSVLYGEYQKHLYKKCIGVCLQYNRTDHISKCWSGNCLLLSDNNTSFEPKISDAIWFARLLNGMAHIFGWRLSVQVQVQGAVSIKFRELSKMFSRKFVYCRNLTSYGNFKLYMCPKHGFGHTYKVSAWNSHDKYDFWHCIFSRGYFEELEKRQWDNPLVMTFRVFGLYLSMHTYCQMESQAHTLFN